MLSSLSMPATREARHAGCPCPTLDRSGWNHYGTWPPPIDIDGLCPVHGLEALAKEHA